MRQFSTRAVRLLRQLGTPSLKRRIGLTRAVERAETANGAVPARSPSQRWRSREEKVG